MAETISTKKDNKAITNPKPNQELTIHYWNSINYFVGLIKSSELKAGLILSFYGILFNFLYQNMEPSVPYASLYPMWTRSKYTSTPFQKEALYDLMVKNNEKPVLATDHQCVVGKFTLQRNTSNTSMRNIVIPIAVGIAALEVVKEDGLAENARVGGDLFREKMKLKH